MANGKKVTVEVDMATTEHGDVSVEDMVRLKPDFKNILSLDPVKSSLVNLGGYCFKYWQLFNNGHCFTL